MPSVPIHHLPHHYLFRLLSVFFHMELQRSCGPATKVMDLLSFRSNAAFSATGAAKLMYTLG